MQEKIERLLDKHMLKLGLSDLCSFPYPRVTNVCFRCVKAVVVDIFIGKAMEEDGKVG